MMATSKLKLATVCGLVAAVLGAGVMVMAQQPTPGTPSPKLPDPPPRVVGLKVGDVKITRRPDLPAVGENDSAEVKGGKLLLKVEIDRLKLILTRIDAGQFQGGSAYQQATEVLTDITAAADEAYPEPKDRLGWYEYRLAVAEWFEAFNQPRVEKGVEEPQLLPQLTAARLKAELALLKAKKAARK